MIRNAPLAIAAGAVLTAAVALLAASGVGAIGERLSSQAEQAIAANGGEGITARFTTGNGWATRHPELHDSGNATEDVRDRVAKAIAAIPGVGGISWADGSIVAGGQTEVLSPLHCQEDVEALLAARTIRFEESSAAIDAGSRSLIDEVADALRPCLGSIIAITGHSDTSGDAAANQRLSQDRADAVRRALIDRGIPADGLRARGMGSAEPVEGLDPADPANRRIDFSVLMIEPLKPTPVDTPGPR
ncbi:OmpA family protein [Altererythrobacter sp. CAU 1778]